LIPEVITGSVFINNF